MPHSKNDAILSVCKTFRYELRRVWNDNLSPLVIGMLNPSTADAENDDPTIRRIKKRAWMLGCGSLIVWNLGAARATSPIDWKSARDPIGPDNDQHTLRIL